MKYFAIVFFASFILLSVLSNCQARTSSDTTAGLPSVINLLANPERSITIIPPPNSKDFQAVAVADINNDGFADIIAAGKLNYVSRYSYTSVIYIIYGAPHLSGTVNFADPALNTASLVWQNDPYPVDMVNFQTGDFNGDGITDIVFLGTALKSSIPPMPDNENKICVLPGKKDWRGEVSISDNTPGLTKIYAGLPNLSYGDNTALNGDMTYGDYAVKDINGDGKPDIIMLYRSEKIMQVSFVGQIYVVYCQANMPAEINAENTICKVTKIQGDTLYRNSIAGFSNVAAGDLDNDGQSDVVFDGGENKMYSIYQDSWPNKKMPELLYGLTYCIYGQVLNSPAYTQPALDLSKNIIGSVSVTTEAQERQPSYGSSSPAITWPDLVHKVFIEDVNGDGYDDLFLGYYSYGGIADGNTRVYVVFGSRDFLSSGKVENYRQGVLKIFSSLQGMHIGNDFNSGDINGDGFNDCLIGTQEDRFFILYGKSAFPDSFQMAETIPYGTTVAGGSFAGCGDINDDGFQDIVGAKTDGSIFILLGKGQTYATGTTLVKPLPKSNKSNYSFAFSDSSRFHFHFTKSGPSYNSELYLTNFGNQLPDSLQSIPTSQKVVSFIQAEITNIDPTYTYRVQCSIDYTDASLVASGIDERNIAVSWWNETKSKWEILQTTIDTLANSATFEVEHFSLFALTDKNDSVLTGIQESQLQNPLTFELSQNYPNPFNPVTTIRFQIPQAGNISLKIYNILGQEVKTLLNKKMIAGNHEIQWDGTNNLGQKVSSGIYIYRMETGKGYINAKKMVYLR